MSDFIKIRDPLSDYPEYQEYREGCFIREGNYIYLRTPHSNCILSLRVGEDNHLYDVVTNEGVGMLMTSKVCPSASS